MECFHELKPYQNMSPLMRLAQSPFYLSAILKLVGRFDQLEFKRIINAEHLSLQFRLIKLVLAGSDPKMVKSRQLAMQALALKKLSETPANENEFVSSTRSSALDLLVRDELLFLKKEGYRFSHDLYFEYALILAWQLKWKYAAQQDKTKKFWNKFSSLLTKPKIFSVFEKWLSLYAEQITLDLIASFSITKSLSYYSDMVKMSFSANNNILFNYFLEQGDILPNGMLSDIPGHSTGTPILFTIWLDYADGLKKLLEMGASPHHPHAGELVHLDSVPYYEKKPNVTQSTLNSNSEENSSENDSRDNYSGDGSNPYRSEDTDSENENNEHRVEYEENFIKSFFERCCKDWQDKEIEDDIDDKLLYLHQAAIYNRPECLLVLLDTYKALDQSSMIYLRNGYKETALHLASLNGANKVIPVLLDSGAEIDGKDIWGETALHNAVYENQLKTAQLLLEKDADVNAINENYLSPFHIALANLNLPIVKLLVFYGANLSLKAFQEQFSPSFTDLLELMIKSLFHKKEKIKEFLLEFIQFLNKTEINVEKNLKIVDDLTDFTYFHFYRKSKLIGELLEKMTIKQCMKLKERAKWYDDLSGLKYIEKFSVDLELKKDDKPIQHLPQQNISLPLTSHLPKSFSRSQVHLLGIFKQSFALKSNREIISNHEAKKTSEEKMSPDF
ncbi:MAG: ankyrin repeat domain-containing protein [Gammaproteobacteria bacterium]|nr:ankyrin repeat domain-containing protein [Gammaproteobacteria bacterium]